MADSGAVLIGRRYSGSAEPDTAWMTQLCTLLLHTLSLFFRSLNFSLIQVRWNREVSLRLRRLALALILFCWPSRSHVEVGWHLSRTGGSGNVMPEKSRKRMQVVRATCYVECTAFEALS